MGAFNTININVKSNPVMSQRNVVHDVRRAARESGLIGWNEIGPARYREAIRNLGPGWSHYMPRDGHLQIPNPISWKNSIWKKEDAGFLRTHRGLARVSPNRYITWARLKHRETGKEIVRINTHLVSGAWGKHKPTTAWRREHWNTHMRKLGDLVERFESRGLKVVIGGDFNRDSFKVLGDQVAYDNKLNVGTHGRSTLDYLMHTRGSGLEKLGARVQGGYASDHDAVIARYSLGGGGGTRTAPEVHRSALTIATVNDDFTDRKTNIGRVKDRADVVMMQEAKNTHVRRAVRGDSFGVHQNVRRDDQAGTALVWRRDKAQKKDSGYEMAVRPHGRAMLNRWINYTDLNVDGTTVRMVSVHRPPPRFKSLWPLFDANLAAFVKSSKGPVVIGLDANQRDPQHLARLTGLRWHAPPGSIDGFLVSPGVEVGKMWRLPRGSSDHNPVLARFHFRTPSP
jgi:hypothetical protein